MNVSSPPPARLPAIVAPLSRHLSVADLDRSIAFYRDVLGFDVRSVSEGDGVPAVAESVHGPARIQLCIQDRAFDSTGGLRPRGSAIEHDLGVMDRDSGTILLIARTERHTGIGSCYVYIRDADALHAELLARGANVQGQPVSHPWGLRDFHVLDHEGNQIRYGQTFE